MNNTQPIAADIEQLQFKECPRFPWFGATYPDAACIEGYLWDLDKYEDGQLYSAGDNPPCPFCNTEEFIEDNIDHDPEADEEDKVTRLDLLRRIQGTYNKYCLPQNYSTAQI